MQAPAEVQDSTIWVACDGCFVSTIMSVFVEEGKRILIFLHQCNDNATRASSPRLSQLRKGISGLTNWLAGRRKYRTSSQKQLVRIYIALRPPMRMMSSTDSLCPN